MSTTLTLEPSHVQVLSSALTTFFKTSLTVWKDPQFDIAVPHAHPQGTRPLSDAHLVVMVHGLTRNSRDFDHVATAMVAEDPEHTLVVGIDVVGRGRSQRLPASTVSSYGYPAYAEQCAGVLASLGADAAGKVSWLGTSMGGLIGLFLCARPGCPISTLVLNDVGPFVPGTAVARIADYLKTRHGRTFADLDAVKAHFKECYAPFGVPDEAGWDHLARHGVLPPTSSGASSGAPLELACDPHIDANIAEPYDDVDLWAVWALLPAANPDLTVGLVCGAESDLLTPEIRDRMAAEGPGLAAGVAVFDGIGHAPALMTADQHAAIIGMFS